MHIQSNLWIKVTQGKDSKWSLLTSGLYLEVTSFYFIKVGLLKCGLYLHSGLYSEVAFNTGLTVLSLLTNKYNTHIFFIYN